MALNKPAAEVLLSFTNGAVAQNTIVKSSEKDLDNTVTADNNTYYGSLYIEAFLDTTTAHTGTRFIVEIYNGKRWIPLFEFIELIGTSNIEAITNNPLAVLDTVITCASTTGYLVGALFGIEDATLGNSEIHRIKALTTNTNLTILDTIAYQHAQNTNMYSVAIQRVFSDIIPISAKKIRVVIDNTYDSDGSTLNCEISMTKVIKL